MFTEGRLPSLSHTQWKLIEGFWKACDIFTEQNPARNLLNPLTPVPAVTGRAKTHPQFPVPAVTGREKACEDNRLSYPP